MYIPEFVCGMLATVMIEVALVAVAVGIHLRRRKECGDAASGRE